jgi:hypothetical protein
VRSGTGFWPADSSAPAKPVPVLRIAQRLFVDVVVEAESSIAREECAL